MYTLSEVARRLDRPRNRKLFRQLAQHKDIPMTRVGNALIVDEAGFQRLKAALAEWDARLKLSSIA